MGDIVRRPSGWYIRYRDVDGTRRMRQSHQPSRELARRYLLEVEGRIARGIVGIPAPAPAAPTVAALCERFLTEYSRPKLKDLGRYRMLARSALRRALPVLGATPANAVTPPLLDRLRATLSQTHAPATVRLTLAFLGRAFSWAVRAQLVADNPLRGVEKPAAPSSLEYLSREEVQTLLGLARAAAATPADRCRCAAVQLALHCGLRRGELLGLRLQDVDLKLRRLTVARSFQTLPKSGKARFLRLPAAILPVLTAWLAEVPRSPGVVFPVFTGPAPRLGGPKDLLGLPALLTAAGCRALRHPWHTLRHTFASHFVMSGGNVLALQRILGHATIAQTMVYAHLGDDFLAGEIDKLSF